MEDKIVYHFTSVLVVIKKANELLKEVLTSTEESQEICYRINEISNHAGSDLELLLKYSAFFEDEDCDHHALLVRINKIIFKYDLREYFATLKRFKTLEREGMSNFQSVVQNLNSKFIQNGDFDFDKTNELIASTDYSFSHSQYIYFSTKFILNNLIDNILDPLKYHVNIKPLEEFDDLDLSKLSPREIEYFQSWVDRTVTVSEWKRNSHLNFRAYIRLNSFDYELLEEIELHQEKLFKEAVSNSVSSMLNNITSLDDQNKVKETIKIHLYLLDTFFLGNADSFTIERIKNLHRFLQPKLVLKHYDEILKSDYFDFDEMHIFAPKRIRQHTALFSANVLYEYYIKLKSLNFTKEILKIESPIRNIKSFGCDTDFAALKLKLKRVNFLVDLFIKEEMFEDFCTLLQSEDFTVDKFELVISCETIQFSYLIRKLRPYFKNLRPVNLERCGSFFTKSNGQKPLKQADIKTIPPSGVKLGSEIDKIFN